jgi:hypothetical protein
MGKSMRNESSMVRRALLAAPFLVAAAAGAVVAFRLRPSSASTLLAALVVGYLLSWVAFFVAGGLRWAELGWRMGLVTASLAFAVGLFELPAALRLMDYRKALGTSMGSPWRHPDNRLDPVLLHIHKPHLRLEWEGVEYRYDRHGLRNRRDMDAADIVVIGDSFVEGWGVPADGLLTVEIERRLRRPVANVAQAWYGPQQELELLRRFGLPLHPSVCVWVFYEGNDLADVVRYRESVQDWLELSRRLQSFSERSFTKNALITLGLLLQGRRPTDLATSAVPPESGVFRLRSGEPVRLGFWPGPEQGLSPETHRSLEEVWAVLAQARLLCEDQGASLLLVFAPGLFRTYGKVTTFAPGAAPLEWAVTPELPDELREMANSLGIGFLDLTPAFDRAAGEGRLLYLQSNFHWSTEGHRAAARVIANWLSHRDHSQLPR